MIIDSANAFGDYAIKATNPSTSSRRTLCLPSNDGPDSDEYWALIHGCPPSRTGWVPSHAIGIFRLNFARLRSAAPAPSRSYRVNQDLRPFLELQRPFINTVESC